MDAPAHQAATGGAAKLGERTKRLSRAVLSVVGSGLACGCILFSTFLTVLQFFAFKWLAGVWSLPVFVALFLFSFLLVICILLDWFRHRWWIVALLLSLLTYFGQEYVTTLGERYFVYSNSAALKRLTTELLADVEVSGIDNSGYVHSTYGDFFVYHMQALGTPDSAMTTFLVRAAGYADRLQKLGIRSAYESRNIVTLVLSGSNGMSQYRYLVYSPSEAPRRAASDEKEQIQSLGYGWYVSIVESESD